MSDRIWAEAPSNIALIKYMGKKEHLGKNLPSNASLSLTLNHLRTRVEVRPISGESDKWVPLEKEGWKKVSLSDFGQTRFLKHWQFLKQELGIKGGYEVSSSNNFPSDCGLASSASSFAALTMAARNIVVENSLGDLQWANLSRQGSGSSCRSFFSPVVYWEGETVKPLDLPYKNLIHQVVVVDGEKKKVSSSEAHKRVSSSLLNKGREERATLRLENLMLAFSKKDWTTAFEVVWAEFWDMHSLFETCQPSFGYMTSGTLTVLNELRAHWWEFGDGPLVTMDAGPNIHLIYREDQKELADQWSGRWKDIWASERV